MLTQLKKSLGIVDLAGIIKDHIRFEEDQRLAMNDRLTDIQELMDVHDKKGQETSTKRHTEMMARLGMILTELQKRDMLPPLRSGYLQVLPGTSLPLEALFPAKPVKSPRKQSKQAKGTHVDRL